MAHQWFVKCRDEELGPLSSGQLKMMATGGRLGPEDPVRLGQEGRWVSARQVKGLLFGTVPPASAIPPLPEAAPIPPPLPDLPCASVPEAQMAATTPTPIQAYCRQDHSSSIPAEQVGATEPAGAPEVPVGKNRGTLRTFKWLWNEARAVAVATFAQTDRLIRYCGVLVRRRNLATSLRDVRLTLGERMHRDGLGDKDILAQMRDLDVQIAQARSAKQPASLLLRRRRHLQMTLADSAYKSHSPTAYPEYDTLFSLQKELQGCWATVALQRAQLLPAKTGERWRIAFGYAAPVFVLLMTVILLAARGGDNSHGSIGGPGNADADLAAVGEDALREVNEDLKALRGELDQDIRGTSKSSLVKGRPINFWIAELADGDVAARCEAAIALGTAKEPNINEAVAALAASLKDGDVRGVAALSLGKLGAEGVRPLVTALEDGDATANSEFVIGLGQAGQPAVRPLIRVLSGGNRNAVASASTALGMIGRPAVSELITALDDPSPQVRSFALLAIQQMGPAANEAVPAIKRRLNDSHPKMRELAEEALKIVSSDEHPAPSVAQTSAKSQLPLPATAETAHVEESSVPIQASDAHSTPYYYPKASQLYRKASDYVDQWRIPETKAAEVELCAELQQRAFLLTQIAEGQASLGDVEGVGISLNRLRKLKALELPSGRIVFDLADALIALPVSHATAGDMASAERAFRQLGGVGTVEGKEKTQSRCLAQLAVVASQQGDLPAANDLLVRLDTFSGGLPCDLAAHSLGELGTAKARMGRTTDAAALAGRIADLCRQGGEANEGYKSAANEAIAGIAIAIAEAGDYSKVDQTVAFIKDSSLSTNGAWFGIGEGFARAMDFAAATRASLQMTEEWRSVRLHLLIAAEQAKCDPVFKDAVVAAIENMSRKIDRFSSTPTLHDQLCCDMAMIVAQSPLHFAVAAKSRDRLVRPEHKARVLAAAGLSAARANKPKDARQLLDESLEWAGRIRSLTDLPLVYTQIGTCYAEALLYDDVLERATQKRSTLARASLLFGAAQGTQANESVLHAARNGVVLTGECTESLEGMAARQALWQEYAGKGDANLESRKFVLLNELGDKDVLAAPHGRGIVLAFPPRLSGIGGLIAQFDVSLFTDKEKERLSAVTASRVGQWTEAGRLRIRKRVAARPAGWIAIEVESKNADEDMARSSREEVDSAREWSEQAAIEAIEKLGGKINREEGRITGISMRGTLATDDDVKHLRGFKTLVRLDINRSKVTGAGLVHLKDLKRLELLNAFHCPIGDDGLQHLAGLPMLWDLALGGTKVTDAGLQIIGRLESLKSLNLSRTEITDDGLRHLRRLENLQNLNIVDTKTTHNGVHELREAMPKLEVVGPTLFGQ